uniref:PDZ domain-containing protein n=1 Tax=Aegilops tauschii TaxID=37682 RepID=M8BGH6_AEGTA
MAEINITPSQCNTNTILINSNFITKVASSDSTETLSYTKKMIPSGVSISYLTKWRPFMSVHPSDMNVCMPRLHLGMTFTSINLLDPVCIERMKRKHNIESGLIVQQVSKGSYAEKLGIRKGDVIEGFNGKYVSTTIELESMLVDICWDHFDQRNKLYAEKDVSVLIYNAAKLCRRTRNLTVVVSDFGEDIIEGTYAITIE